MLIKLMLIKLMLIKLMLIKLMLIKLMLIKLMLIKLMLIKLILIKLMLIKLINCCAQISWAQLIMEECCSTKQFVWIRTNTGVYITTFTVYTAMAWP